MRILVVEDEPAVAAALQRGLAAEGFDVDVASDGDTGVWMASEHEYSLVILDVMLPQRNGYLVCADLRAAGRTMPILMLTAKDGEYDEAEGLDAGADDYVTKPFSFVVLLARVRALLRRGAPKESTLRLVGGLELDLDRRICRRGEDEIALTSRELALLEALARDPGVVWSKQQLLDQVWGPDFDGGVNVVEVYIGYLRKKLHGDGHPRVIDTVHGHGYRVVP